MSKLTQEEIDAVTRQRDLADGVFRDEIKEEIAGKLDRMGHFDLAERIRASISEIPHEFVSLFNPQLKKKD